MREILSAETRAGRDMVDAIRCILGVAPLYNDYKNQNLESNRVWSSDLTDNYYEIPRHLRRASSR